MDGSHRSSSQLPMVGRARQGDESCRAAQDAGGTCGAVWTDPLDYPTEVNPASWRPAARAGDDRGRAVSGEGQRRRGDGRAVAAAL